MIGYRRQERSRESNQAAQTLEEEIAKSLERRRKRPSRGEGREAEKKRREIVEESSNEMEVEQDSELDLPVINLPPATPRQPFSVAASITPFLSANNNNCSDKQTNNNSKQSSDNSKQTGKQTTEKENNSRETTSATNKDEDFREPSSKVATKKNRAGSKVVSKSTKRAVTTKKSTKSTKSTVAAKKRAVVLGKINTKKRGGGHYDPRVVTAEAGERSMFYLPPSEDAGSSLWTGWRQRRVAGGGERHEMTDSFPAAKYFREEREEAGHLYRSSLFKEAGSVCISPSTSPPALQLEMLLVAGGANVTRSMRKADVCVGCHSPREGLDEGGAVSVTEAWILGVSEFGGREVAGGGEV
ncbi:hypothetical protein GBAR_LOCUS18248 [Geodia barretti]|uniref:Uncharacterized protein n=1 Tax=Geodia barretti TaxID=519541 RepID=A0AA35SNC4_GEOBA|nr:hypothetical protein GBAR_LOCUS18248 [Geodia barretti]